MPPVPLAFAWPPWGWGADKGFPLLTPYITPSNPFFNEINYLLIKYIYKGE